MSLKESTEIIKMLLLELKTNEQIEELSDNLAIDLNSNTIIEDGLFKNFSGNIEFDHS